MLPKWPTCYNHYVVSVPFKNEKNRKLKINTLINHKLSVKYF